MAARALKAQNWRFHQKQLQWFQRSEEPKSITPEFEVGSYAFFDTSQWLQLRRDFKFEYAFLEDKDLS